MSKWLCACMYLVLGAVIFLAYLDSKAKAKRISERPDTVELRSDVLSHHSPTSIGKILAINPLVMNHAGWYSTLIQTEKEFVTVHEPIYTLKANLEIFRIDYRTPDNAYICWESGETYKCHREIKY